MFVMIRNTLNETVIYCDPPYKNVGKYQNNIDHDKFDEWVKVVNIKFIYPNMTVFLMKL